MKHLFSTLDDAFRGVLDEVLIGGTPVAPRGMKTLEVLNRSFTILDSRANVLVNPVRQLNHAFAVAEWLWILTGRRDVRSIVPFNKNIGKYSDDGESFFGAYGPWYTAQLPYVVKTLREDPDTRQAVVTLWQQSPPKTKDVPCTVTFQYLLRAGELHAHTFMRSNDAWLGLPYDVFNFTQLQAWVAAQLDVRPGPYTHTVGSLHLYEENWEKARDAAMWRQSSPVETLRSPALTTRANLLEEVSGMFGEIGHYAPPYVNCFGETIASFPKPWDGYLGLLAWYRTKGLRGDKSHPQHPGFLREPYAGLVG